MKFPKYAAIIVHYMPNINNNNTILVVVGLGGIESHTVTLSMDTCSRSIYDM